VSEFYEAAYSGDQTKEEKALKEIAEQAYIWAIWKGRNDALFNYQAFNPLRTANYIQSLIFLWCFSRVKNGRRLDWTNWCCYPSL